MTSTPREIVAAALRSALSRAAADLGWGDEVAGTAVAVERPAEAAHGDYATGVAMKLAKPLRRPPVEIAEAIRQRRLAGGHTGDRSCFRLCLSIVD